MSTPQTSLFSDEPAPAGETVALADLANNQEADFFALLSAKEELTTKDGKPYFRVAFRDSQREVNFPIWGDSAWAEACRTEWEVGGFFKLRAKYRETNYGPQLDIRRIRAANDEDRADGFDPAMCLPMSRFDPEEMYQELVLLVSEHIEDKPLADFVSAILHQYQETLLVLPAAQHNHHAHIGGFLEHVLSVTKTCVYLADKYAELYPDMQPPLRKDLVVAGGTLHDIGKVRELTPTATGAEYSSSGVLIGHILQGRDILRETAAEHTLDDETLLRLEHIIVSHQRLAEWGSPKPPMFPEALLVHYADDCDAKFTMMAGVLEEDPTEGPFTGTRNALRQRIYRGG
ncbi:MAG: HD domain-containing protein [Planctomycetota bacterium]